MIICALGEWEEGAGSQAHLPCVGWSSYSTPQPAGLPSTYLFPIVQGAFLVLRMRQTEQCTGTQGNLEGGGKRGAAVTWARGF